MHPRGKRIVSVCVRVCVGGVMLLRGDAKVIIAETSMGRHLKYQLLWAALREDPGQRVRHEARRRPPGAPD